MRKVSLAAASLMVALVASSAATATAADANAGKALAAPCAACHGENGVAVLPGAANLAGQNEKYLLRQLQLIKTDKRPVPTMAGQLNQMSDTDLENLAAHYASLAPTVGQAKEQSLVLGSQIYRGGIVSRGVPACTACHSPTGRGNPPAGFPHLSGQAADYVVTQLKAYREGQRVTDEDYGGMMRAVASNLTDTEMAALANYIHGLH